MIGRPVQGDDVAHVNEEPPAVRAVGRPAEIVAADRHQVAAVSVVGSQPEQVLPAVESVAMPLVK